jgi:hypothetical protein
VAVAAEFRFTRALPLAGERPGLKLLAGYAAIAEVVDGDARGVDVEGVEGLGLDRFRSSSVAKPTVMWAM